MVAKQQKNFLLSITHELKSPLAAIKLQLQTLNSRNLPEEKRLQIYSRALGDTDRLEKLVENLLLINKVESGGMPLNRKSTDVSEALIVQMKQTYPKELDENRIELSISRNISATIDELAFQSIVQNLVDNAIKYGSNGKIEVRLKAANNGFEFSVSDQGEGIPDKEKQKIFERFYRLGSEDVRKTKGTGIGLYIVKALVEKHKGKILVEDNQPQGSIFKVQLPTDLK
jgi:signal transduction histidine kinase